MSPQRDIRRARLHADVLNALDTHYNEVGYVLMDFTREPVAFANPAPGRALRLTATWTF